MSEQENLRGPRRARHGEPGRAARLPRGAAAAAVAARVSAVRGGRGRGHGRRQEAKRARDRHRGLLTQQPLQQRLR